MINQVLVDLLAFLKNEPQGIYLKLLNDEALPQVREASLQMVQFRAALDTFRSRYRFVDDDEEFWVTPESIAEWRAENEEDNEEYDDDDDDDDESWEDDDDDESWEG